MVAAAAASPSKTPPVQYDVFIDEKITFSSGVIVCTASRKKETEPLALIKRAFI